MSTRYQCPNCGGPMDHTALMSSPPVHQLRCLPCGTLYQKREAALTPMPKDYEFVSVGQRGKITLGPDAVINGRVDNRVTVQEGHSGELHVTSIWAGEAPPAQSGAIGEAPTDEQIHSACLSWDHSYGLMPEGDQRALELVARAWWRCIARAANGSAAP